MILIVSDQSLRGIQAAARIQELVGELKMRVPAVKLIVNRAPGGELNRGVLGEIERHCFDFAGVIPVDENIFEYDSEGRPTVELPEGSPARVAFFEMLGQMNV
jgi:CO dehydrogenase maturation factor